MLFRELVDLKKNQMWLQNEFGSIVQDCFKYNIHCIADLYAQSLFLALKCQFSEECGSNPGFEYLVKNNPQFTKTHIETYCLVW